MTWIRDAFRFLVFSNYWISFAATAYAYLTVVQLDLRVTSGFYWFVFTSTLCSYCLQRYVQLPERKEVLSERQNWLVTNRFYLGATVVVSGIAAAILGLTILNMEQILWLLPVGLISLLYSIRFIGNKRKKSGLRDLPGIKIFMIAISWVFLCGFLPVWINGLDRFSMGELLLICVEKLLFVIAITIPFDIRDLRYDDARKKTIPQLLGISGSIYLATALLVIGCIIAFAGSVYSPEVITGLGLSTVSTIWILLNVHKDTPELYYSGLIDGTLILQLLLVIGTINLL